MSKNKWTKWAGLTALVVSIATVEQVALAKPATEKADREEERAVGDRGDLALGLENMTAASYSWGGGPFGTSGEDSHQYEVRPLNLGSLAADYFVGQWLSVGATVGAWGGRDESPTWRSSNSSLDIQTRLGYLVSLGGPKLWLRAGLGYSYARVGYSNTERSHQDPQTRHTERSDTLLVSAEPALLLPVYDRTFVTILPAFSQLLPLQGDQRQSLTTFWRWQRTLSLGGGITVIL